MSQWIRGDQLSEKAAELTAHVKLKKKTKEQEGMIVHPIILCGDSHNLRVKSFGRISTNVQVIENNNNKQTNK